MKTCGRPSGRISSIFFASFFFASAFSFLLFFAFPVFSEDEPAPKGWNPEVKTAEFISPYDSTPQKALIYIPTSEMPVPLIVGLHTWSADYTQVNSYFYDGAKKYGWAMICPNFRGPNNTPKGCGSEAAVADIAAAVEYMKTRTKIDSDRIYLMGMSGGGYGSMLLAGRHPEIWAGVCSGSEFPISPSGTKARVKRDFITRSTLKVPAAVLPELRRRWMNSTGNAVRGRTYRTRPPFRS